MITDERPYVSELFQSLEEKGRQKGREEGREEGRDEGRAEAKAEAVLMLLDGRGVEVSQEVRERISACRDEEQLSVWLLRAARVDSVEALFS